MLHAVVILVLVVHELKQKKRNNEKEQNSKEVYTLSGNFVSIVCLYSLIVELIGRIEAMVFVIPTTR
jgi:hypothetical protein